MRQTYMGPYENYKKTSMRNVQSNVSNIKDDFKSQRSNYLNDQLTKENAELKKELHQLRKMEAGWFGKDKNIVKKEVIVKNNHYLEEKELITNEINILKEKYSQLLADRDALLNKNRLLAEELNGFKNGWMNEKQALMGQIGQLKNQTNVVIQQDNTDFDAIINQYKQKNAMLNDELARLQALLVQHNNEINTLKMRESKTVSVIK